MDGGDRILVAAGLTAAVVVGAFVLWGPGGAPKVRKRRGQIAGLQNLGRTCFLNTLLQALAACPTFIDWLRKYAKADGHNSMITTLYTVIEGAAPDWTLFMDTYEKHYKILEDVGVSSPRPDLFLYSKHLRRVILVELTVPWETNIPRDYTFKLNKSYELTNELSRNKYIVSLYAVEVGARVVNGTHESARGTPVCPLGVLQSLRAAGWVVPADQQDAHELLHVLLSCIEEETTAMSKKPGCLSDALGLGGGRAWSALASPASPPSAPLRPARPASAAPAGEPDLADPEPSEPPPARLCKGVSRSFCHLSAVGRRWAAAPARPAPQPPSRGALATRTHCTVCSTKSPVRYDKFDSISLSMANASTGLTGTFSLAGLLRAFTAPEMVSGVRCSKCCPEEPPAAGPAPRHAYTKHIRTVNFGKLPGCLVLQVARVEWRCGAPAKRADHVAFPETLAMAPYTSAPRPQPELSSLLSEGRLRGGLSVLNAGPAPDDGALYRLTAVVVHVGGPRSGHFATYRRGNGFESKRWWYTSDTLVHEVSLAEVLRCSAYMLFYERCAAPPPPLTTHF